MIFRIPNPWIGWINGGGGRIRTCEGRSPGDLQSPAFGRLATPPTGIVLPQVCAFRRALRPEPPKALGSANSIGAGDGTRTRDLRLGRPLLYQLSYARFLAPGAGLEPATRGLTVPRSAG